MSSARAIVLTTMEPSLHGWLMIMDVDDSYSSVCGGGGEEKGCTAFIHSLWALKLLLCLGNCKECKKKVVHSYDG